MIDNLMTWAASALFIGGSLLTLMAALGLVRFPDVLARMHGVTKPGTLGIFMFMTGLALHLRSLDVAWKLALVVMFQLITSPVSAHMIGRAAVRTKKMDSELLVVDELSEDLARGDISYGESSPRN